MLEREYQAGGAACRALFAVLDFFSRQFLEVPE